MMRRVLCAWLCGLLGYASAEPLVLVSPLPLDEPHVARLKQVLDQAFAPLPDSYRLQYLPPKRALEALAGGQVVGDISRIALYGSLVPDAIRVQPYLSTAWLYLVARRGDSLPRACRQRAAGLHPRHPDLAAAYRGHAAARGLSQR